MLTSDSILHLSGLVLTILVSVSVLNYTAKFIFGNDKIKKPTNQIYDPDYGLNISHICTFSKNPFSILYENTPCHNKTLPQWYNPWFRDFIWKEFWNEITTRKQIEELNKIQKEKEENETKTATTTETTTTTEAPQLGKKPAQNQKVKEGPSELLYSILVGLLIMSAVAACWEVFKDKLKRNEAAAAKLQERQCSLADFTINRHLRRESQQQQSAGHLPRQASLELTAKVTQTLVHQSSLDRAFPKSSSEAMKSVELRRNSVPSYLISSTQPLDKISNRNFSRMPLTSPLAAVELVGEEIVSDTRKKPRHFIRRH